MKKEQYNEIIKICSEQSREFIKSHYQELLRILEAEGEKGLRLHLEKYSK